MCRLSGSRPVWRVQTRARRSLLCGRLSDVQVRQCERHLPAVSSQLHRVSRLYGAAGHCRAGSVQLVCAGSLRRRGRSVDNALSAWGHRVHCWLLPRQRATSPARTWRRKTGKSCLLHLSLSLRQSLNCQEITEGIKNPRPTSESHAIKTAILMFFRQKQIIDRFLEHCHALCHLSPSAGCTQYIRWVPASGLELTPQG